MALETIKVHPRIKERHPDLSKNDIVVAWNNSLRFVGRKKNAFDEVVAIGFDPNGRLIEMVAVVEDDGSWLIFHAMTPPSKNTLNELGL